MMRGLRRGCAALALAVVPVGYGPAADTDGLVPDLEITVVGIKDPAKPREVTVRVTNVGPAWADHTRATVWAEPESAGKKLEGEDVLDLSPIGKEKEQSTPSRYEFTYTLAAPCGGQKVTLHASLTAGEDWEGDPEPKENMVNNVIPRPGQDGVVCPGPAVPQGNLAPPQPQGNAVPSNPNGGVLKPARSTPSKKAALEEAILGPEHTRPGKHELELAPSARDSLTRRFYTDTSAREVEFTGPDALFVGWAWMHSSPAFLVSQTALNFDLSKLLEVSNPSIEEAHLSFIESPTTGTPEFWDRRELPGCVVEVGIATNNWTLPPMQHIGGDFLFRDTTLTFKTLPHELSDWEIRQRLRWRAFDVTGHVKNQVQNPGNRELWFGYVLHGAIEDERIRPDGGCQSQLLEPRLWVTYVVPPS
jgi:hypothetical protein